MAKRIFVQYGVKLRVCYQIWLKFAHNKAVDLPRPATCVRGGLTSALSRLGIGCNILGYDGPQLCSVADSASKKRESSRSLAFENGC